MLEFLRHAFPLQRRDLDRGGLLVIYLFFIGAAYMMARIARDALFLAQYPADMLPYADVTVALMVPLVVGPYIWIGERAGLRRALIGSLILFGLGGLVSVAFIDSSLMSPVCYVLIGVFGVLAPAQGWTLANYVLAPREAKRLFGLVAAGASAGAMFGGLAARVLTEAFGAASLLPVTALLLFVATGVVEKVWRRRPADLADLDSRPAGGRPSRSLREGLRVVADSSYLRAVAAVIGLSSLVTYVIGWQFKAFVRQFVFETAGPGAGRDALASFFGGFEAAAGVACLCIQILLTTGLLRRSALRTVLFALPVGLLLGSFGLLISGSLVALMLPRAIDRVIRYSIDKPAVELLYLPVPLSQKLAAKSFIDTVVWRAGDGIGGSALLAVVTLGGLSAVQLTWVVMALIVLWLLAAALAYRRYLTTLEDSLQRHRVDVERAATPILDRATTDMLATRLEAVDPREILYALDLMSASPHQGAHPAVRGLLDHPAPEVRRRALEILGGNGDPVMVEKVETLLCDPSLEVRTEALLYLARYADVDPVTRLQDLGDFTDASIRGAVVAVLTRLGEERHDSAQMIFETMVSEDGPEGRETRREAARLAESLPVLFEEPLRRLLQDEDVEVTRAAIHAARRHGALPFADVLIGHLGHPALRNDAREALSEVGPDLLEHLARILDDPQAPPELRQVLPEIVEHIGGDEAAALLADRLLENNAALRLGSLRVLSRLRERRADLEIDTWALEAALGAEILGHYRSYQILGALERSPLQDEPATRGLRIAMVEELERIFLLLGLLYPGTDFRAAWHALRSGNPVLRDQALDLLETQLRPAMRKLLVPLIDPEVPGEKRMRMGEQLAGTPVEGPIQAVKALAITGDPWLRSCAAYAIGAQGLRELDSYLEAWQNDPDPLLRETVRQAWQQLRELDPGHEPRPQRVD
jgi:ATP/ADP translocase/HEAT repeat protein